MPTKEDKRHARGLVEALEFRVHAGPPVCATEIRTAREFLEQRDFSSASDYFSRLAQIQNRLVTRPMTRPQEKRNYGGQAAGCWMQLQSVYDHVILSVCHQGEFNAHRGRVKISHRFNRAGRIDFVELKLLRSLQPGLDGALRKLLTVKNYPDLEADWLEAEAFALRVLPQELIFLHQEVFRFRRDEVLAWLINLGHRTAADLLEDMRAHRINGCHAGPARNPEQLPLKEVQTDQVAVPILRDAAALEAAVDFNDSETIFVRYHHK